MPLSDQDRRTLDELAQASASGHRVAAFSRFLSLVELAFQTGVLSPEAAADLGIDQRRMLGGLLPSCLYRRLAGDVRFDFAYANRRWALTTLLQLPIPQSFLRLQTGSTDSELTTDEEPDFEMEERDGTVSLIFLENHERLVFLFAFASLLQEVPNIVKESFCQFHQPQLSSELAKAYECLGMLRVLASEFEEDRVETLRTALFVIAEFHQPQFLVGLLATPFERQGGNLSDRAEDLADIFDGVRTSIGTTHQFNEARKIHGGGSLTARNRRAISRLGFSV